MTSKFIIIEWFYATGIRKFDAYLLIRFVTRLVVRFISEGVLLAKITD